MSMSPSPSIVILELPVKALCGLDQVSFNTTPQFRGIKDLPPGWHFVFVAASDSYSIRHGTWVKVRDPDSDDEDQVNEELELFVHKWDSAAEELAILSDTASLMFWRANLGSLWNTNLVSYDKLSVKDTQKDWPDLTSQIDSVSLSRILGTTTGAWTLTSASSAAVDLDQIPGLLPSERSEVQKEKELKFLPIDLKKKTWREGATGRERTEAALDHSWYLNDLLVKHCAHGAKEVIAEMQFCFLMVLLLNNWSCLEQWRRILELIFTCKDAVARHEGFFVECIRLLHTQLRHCGDVEAGLFDLHDEESTFLKPLLKKFKQNVADIDNGTTKSNIVDELDELEGFLASEFGWDMNAMTMKSGMLDLEDGERVEIGRHGDYDEDDDGDYAPVVVELTPEQIQLLTGSDATLPAKALKEMTLEERDHEEEGLSGKDDEDSVELDDMDERY